MSNVINVQTWEECNAKIQEIKRQHPKQSSEFLFRGQANSKWQLTTTLERRGGKKFNVIDYYRLALRIRSQIETESGLRWDVPSCNEISDWARDYDRYQYEFKAYEYLSHLRHNGFPSPLLDWSRSLQVAAYFAFSSATCGMVAIYVYLEQPNSIKARGPGSPAIRTLGQYVRTHRRHFRQQSTYTVCANYLKDDSDNSYLWRLASHEEIFGSLGKISQDLLWKIVIPVEERKKVLANLDEFNLNAYSLFGSEESLMETLAYREIDLKPLAEMH